MLFRKSEPETPKTSPGTGRGARCPRKGPASRGGGPGGPQGTGTAGQDGPGPARIHHRSELSGSVGLPPLDAVHRGQSGSGQHAEQVLDRLHYGLHTVKERILEYLAGRTLCSLQTARILVVDDEEIARTNMEYILRKDGYQVASCRQRRGSPGKISNPGLRSGAHRSEDGKNGRSATAASRQSRSPPPRNSS